MPPRLDWRLLAGVLAPGDRITGVDLLTDARADSPPGNSDVTASDARMAAGAEVNYLIS